MSFLGLLVYCGVGIIYLLAQSLALGCWLFGWSLGVGLGIVAFVVFVLAVRLVCLSFLGFLVC